MMRQKTPPNQSFLSHLLVHNTPYHFLDLGQADFAQITRQGCLRHKDIMRLQPILNFLFCVLNFSSVIIFFIN